MANTIKIRRSAVQGAAPTTAQLALGELALNTYDGKLFLKKNNGSESIVEIGAGGDVTLAGANAFTGANTFANTTTLLNQQPLRFSETTGNGTNYVALRAPASIDADITWTLPSTDGASGSVLSTNASGTLSWRSITTSTSDPSGGADGDIWIKYTA